jgi:hypothetical protein
MEAGEPRRQRKHHEVERRLMAIKAIADAFVKQHQYGAGITMNGVPCLQLKIYDTDWSNCL